MTNPNPTDGQRGTRHPYTRRAFLAGGLGGLLALGGGTAWALDRFVIEHVEATNTSANSSSSVASATEASNGAFSVDSYASDTAKIAITRHTSGSGSDTITWFVADITVTDATLVRSAFADDEFGQNIIAYPSAIAAQAGAVLAINGDYYGFRDTGIVIRNGVAYRDRGVRQGLAFRSDGSMTLYDETTTTAARLVADGVWNTLSFGPGLVDDGRVISGIDDIEIDTNVGNHSVQGQQPRTAVGVVDDNHFLFVVVDGRSSGYSRGMTMTELATAFVDLGATVAYNLDGGGSSAMIFNSQLVNNPLGKGQERGTSDIIYVAG
ncbi:MAG TPA: phosphodiester glycosidase family protein [Propionicimonas sp.]|uniref:phosphodiester glycosidase family protein n=1 Tax=Propionicimonas sp. TaxID=1955623 RepID=UPI002F3FA68A